MSDLIKQQELVQYRKVTDEATRLAANQEALRDALISRIKEGAQVEPGNLTANLDEGSQGKRFSFGALVKILGLKKAEELKMQLPESVYQSLKVIEVN